MINEAELASQRKRARANLDMVKLKKRSGLATQDDLNQAQLIFDKLKNYVISGPPVAQKSLQANEPPAADHSPAVVPMMPVDEFTKLMDDLGSQYAQARKAMAIKSNELVAIPASQNAKALVDEIQEMKQAKNVIGEKIGYLKAHGKLPEPEPVSASDLSPDEAKSAFMVNLPTERYELNKLLVNVLQPKLYRRKQALQKAKQPKYMAQYGKEVAQLELQIELVKSRISAYS